MKKIKYKYFKKGEKIDLPKKLFYLKSLNAKKKKNWQTKIGTKVTKEKITNLVYNKLQFSSVQFSRSVVSDSLRPHESQHARPPCPSPTPRVHSD